MVERVFIAKVGRLAHTGAPLADPLPEQVAGMTLEAPGLRLSAVMHEELGEHFGAGADAEEFGVGSEFGPVVWRRGGGGAESVGDAAARLDQLIEQLGGVMLDHR